MIVQSENAEDIVSAYFVKHLNVKKNMNPTYIFVCARMCVPSYFID